MQRLVCIPGGAKVWNDTLRRGRAGPSQGRIASIHVRQANATGRILPAAPGRSKPAWCGGFINARPPRTIGWQSYLGS